MFPVAILAGGVATRLQPLTETIPKALLDVNGEPFIAHQLRLLRAYGIDRVVVCTGYLGEMIQAYVGDGACFGLRIEYSFDGPRLLRTGGALKKALPLLGETFFVLYGDTYLPCDYRAVQTEFEKSGKPALMTVFRNDDRWDRSNIEFVEGRILAYDKRNQTVRMRHIDYGLGAFSQRAFMVVPPEQPYDLHQRFYEIGSLEGLEETRRYLSAQVSTRERGVI